MGAINNLWKNDKGFLWMLIISVLILISSQLTNGIIGESKFIVRFGFFLFTVIAVKSSTLSRIGKSIGYLIASSMLLLALVLFRTEIQSLVLIYSVISIGYMVYIIALVVNQIFAGGPITMHKLGGGVAVYILLGHLWASLFLAIYIVEPTAFQFGGEFIPGDQALRQLSYFSFVTLTTIGYGDLTALNSMARILAMLEGLIGQLFPAIFIAKLVSQQIVDSKK